MYASKFLRMNLRFGDLLKLETWQLKIKEILPFINAQLRHFGIPEESEKKLMLKMRTWSDNLSPIICDGFSMLHRFIDEDKRVLFEGQLGVMKDIDLGIYPYVTSSNPLAAYAAVSGGFPASKIKEVCGVVKAFASAVGDGPFPTEMEESESAVLQGSGENPDDEYGARTGRKRRIGWLDIPILKYANAVNGFTELALTKLDKLDSLKTIKVCVGYMLDGSSVSGMPDTDNLYRVLPVYKEFEGWQSSTSECKTYDELPVNAKKYIDFIEEQVKVSINYIGNGPKRSEIIKRIL
ncbi:MAG: adenylosuccinate synthetase [Eubacteriales bacterium]|nr:adenylosuccinate synthetase [Eubacteriales bacterium]